MSRHAGQGRCLSALALVWVLCAGTASALDPNRALTQYVHRIWTVQQGLPAGTIYDIWQTRDSFLWLGTQTGLERFDGVRFTPASSLYKGLPEGLWIRAGLEDANGALWVGTNEAGVFRIEKGKVTHFSSQEGLLSDVVFCLVPGANGDLWACTGNGLAHFPANAGSGKVNVLHLPEASGPDVVRAASLAADGTLWVGGDKPVIYSLRPDSVKFEAHPLHSVPSDASVRSITFSNGSLWIGTNEGLVELKGFSEKAYTEKDGLADAGVLSLSKDTDGSLWIGTRSGFSRMRNGEFESFLPQDGLSQSSVFSVYVDREGSLWVGTKHGLNQFLEGRAIPFTSNEGLPSDQVGPLFQDTSGGIWVGTLDAGLARFSRRRFSVLSRRHGLASNAILALAGDGDGGVWVGTNHGLNRVKANRITGLFTTRSGLPSDEIRALYRDRAGTLWIGTEAGMAVFKQGHISIPDGTPRDAVLALAGDKDGLPLFSTEHGVFRIKEGTVSEIAPNGVSLRGVDAIYLDTDGLVWMGLNGAGLRLLDEKPDGQMTVTAFYMRDGLFDSEIFGIVHDNQDLLWMACSKGIFSVSRTDLLRFAAGKIKELSSTPYSPTDALRVIECKPGVQPGVWKMRDGKLWFSTIRGLIVLDPAHLHRDVPPPPVVIEDPIVNGQTETAGRIGSLAPGRKNLEFNYTGLSFLSPNRITFRYILEGYDRNWIDAGTRREAFYTNLPPGTFRFRVTACNVEGLCNTAGSAIEFTLAAHYYQRIWFFPSLLGAIALIAWLAYQLRIRHLRERYDLILAERSRIARELHDTLIQGFSGITMAMQALSARLRSSEERSRLEDIIHDAATCLRETRRSVAGLRGVRQPESGLAAVIAEAARQITETKDVRLKMKLDKGPQGLPPEFEYNLLRITSEAITNSVKHSGARTIEVNLKCARDEIRLTVSDDGSGFEHAGNGHIRPGHYGLIGMRERAAQIGAEFEFQSAPGRGTTVSVVAPVGRSAVMEAVK